MTMNLSMSMYVITEVRPQTDQSSSSSQVIKTYPFR